MEKKRVPKPVQLPSGSWRCQVMVNGRSISIIEDDPNIAKAKAIAAQAEMIERERTRKVFLPLSDAITEYIEMKSNILSPSTVRGYKTIQRNRLQTLMKKNVYAITKRDVQIAINKEAAFVSPKTISNVYGLVRPVLKEYGIEVFGIRLPQKIKPSKKYLQPEEISSFLEAADGDPCEAAVLLAVWLGMRRSEIFGLCWDCIDNKGNRIIIRRTMVPDETNTLVLKDGAKNITSQRIIQCPQYIMNKIMKSKPNKAKPTDRVFSFHPETMLRHIHAICKTAGITDTTTHGLRHTNAAIMKHIGVDDLHAMQRGGWSTEATYKKTYAYVFDSAAKAQDDKIDSFFKKKTPENFSHEK